MKKIKQTFETELGSVLTHGEPPFSQDTRHGILNVRLTLNPEFKPGDRVEVIVRLLPTLSKER
jgi:hypothetical protein